MMTNPNSRYGVIAKVLHWLSAVFIVPAMSIGVWFAITDLDTDYGWEQFERYIDWHVGFGITVVVLMLPRLVWRLTHTPPVPTEDDNTTRARFALVVHSLMYAVAILTPLTGWLGSSLEGHTLHYFSVLEITPFLGTHPKIASAMTDAHFYLSWAFVALLSAHLSGVLYHHLWLKDRILRRML